MHLGAAFQCQIVLLANKKSLLSVHGVFQHKTMQSATRAAIKIKSKRDVTNHFLLLSGRTKQCADYPYSMALYKSFSLSSHERNGERAQAVYIR